MSRHRTPTIVLCLLTALVCSAHSAVAQSLYWLDTQYASPTLKRSDLDGLGVTSLALSPGTLPEGLAADASGRVFWTESSWWGARVQRASHLLSGAVTLVPGGSSLRGIAVDAAAQRLYWTSSNLASGSAVHRSDITGTNAVSLIALGSSANPRGIAVDAANGRILWTDFDQQAIYTASLSGGAPTQWLALTPGSGPYGIVVEPGTNRVYWTEYGSGLLRRADANGTNVTQLASGLAQPTYLALDAANGRLYWTEGAAGNQRIRRANVNGNAPVTLPPSLTSYGGIAIGSGNALSAETDELPREFAIERVWPTPGTGPLHIGFALPREASVNLSVLDLQGRLVRVLADGVLPPGRHERRWNGNSTGGTLGAGVYFARLSSEGRSWVKRIVVTR